jgi:amino acid transporter
MAVALKRLFIGNPIASALAHHERLTKRTALAVFSSDALSSVAYATEEILLVLALAVPVVGAIAFWYSLPIAVGIVLLLVIVTTSYRQTIHAYPNGGGAYIVSKENLGELPGLVAGAALLIDYVLTVAVSIAAGVAAITSAYEPLRPYRVELCLAAILLVALANLRGVKESGAIFAVPTYLFIGSILVMIAAGLLKYYWLDSVTAVPLQPPRLSIGGAVQGVSLLLLLRAFASGCTALTGVEAISNGIPAFKPPESRNAATTLTWMAGLLITLFSSLTLLAYIYQITPVHEETVVSQLARAIFSDTSFAFFYYVIQAATAMILILAANTSFADFPRLASILARDRYLPRQFASRGDRLVFSNGVIVLAVLAGLLVIIFSGDTHALIPLYAVGVFLSFTLSQSGMVRHWLKERDSSRAAEQAHLAHQEARAEMSLSPERRALRGPEPAADSRSAALAEMTEVSGWRKSIVINAIGALATGIVLLDFIITKFTHGAWVVVVLIPLFVLFFKGVHGHYLRIARELSLEGVDPAEAVKPIRHTVIVPVSGIHRGVLMALRYGRSIAPGHVTAVYINLDDEATAKMLEKWDSWSGGVPLTVLESPYRSIMGPLINYIHQMEIKRDDDLLTIVLPEFVPARWWHHLLHNQTSLLIKGALLFTKNKIVTSVPYHLKD